MGWRDDQLVDEVTTNAPSASKPWERDAIIDEPTAQQPDFSKDRERLQQWVGGLKWPDLSAQAKQIRDEDAAVAKRQTDMVEFLRDRARSGPGTRDAQFKQPPKSPELPWYASSRGGNWTAGAEDVQGLMSPSPENFRLQEADPKSDRWHAMARKDFEQRFPGQPWNEQVDKAYQQMSRAYSMAQAALKAESSGDLFALEGLGRTIPEEDRAAVASAVEDLSGRQDRRTDRPVLKRFMEGLAGGSAGMGKSAIDLTQLFGGGEDAEAMRFGKQLTAVDQAGNPPVRDDEPFLTRGVVGAAPSIAPMAVSMAGGGLIGAGAKTAGGAWASRLSTVAAERVGSGFAFAPQMTEDSYLEMNRQGIEDKYAIPASIVSGLLQAAVEGGGYQQQIHSAGGGRFLNSIALGAVKRMVTSTAGEWSEEWTQAGIDEASQYIARELDGKVPQKAAKEIGQRIVTQGMGSLPAVVVLGGPSHVATGLAARDQAKSEQYQLQQAKDLRSALQQERTQRQLDQSLSPQAAQDFAQNAPAAAALTRMETPSRKQWEALGLPQGTSAEQRKAFADQVRQTVRFGETSRGNGEAVPAATPGVQSVPEPQGEAPPVEMAPEPSAVAPAPQPAPELAPEPQEAPAKRPLRKPKMTFEQFRDEYTRLFQEMNKYDVGEIGSIEYADRMAALSDQYPEWAERVETESQPTPQPEEPAPVEQPELPKQRRFTITEAADELQAIRDDLASMAPSPDEDLIARVDAVGQWAATQGNAKSIGKILEESHSLRDRLEGGSGRKGQRIVIGGQQPTPSALPAPSIKVGDRVSYQKGGKSLTGTVTTVYSGDQEVRIKADQSASAGGVPIGRIDYVPLSSVQPEATTPPVQSGTIQETPSEEPANVRRDETEQRPALGGRTGTPEGTLAGEAGAPGDVGTTATAPRRPGSSGVGGGGSSPRSKSRGRRRDGQGTGAKPAAGTEPQPARESEAQREGTEGDRGDDGPSADRGRERPVDHSIAADDEIVPKGQTGKVDANLKAIQLLKTLETEDRAATPEEKKILARYVGWGALSQAFDEIKGKAMEQAEAGEQPWKIWNRDEKWEKKWGRHYKALKSTLTREEFAAASASTLNAHYTSRSVIDAMWRMVRRLGFEGGNVLEPAAGIGHFIGLRPSDLGRTKFVAVELDSLTSRFLKKLYPGSRVFGQGLEVTDIPANSIDLAITNVPFAKTGPEDAKERYGLNLNLHNYFIARMLDAVKPGGLAVAISTHNTMDSEKKQREFLATKGDLVAAIRLPDTAFKENAGTEVVTDILILRKPDSTLVRSSEPWTSVATVSTGAETTEMVNEYFVRHPEMVLGEHSQQGTMYGPDQYTVKERAGTSLADLLNQAIERLPENVISRGKAEAVDFSRIGEATGIKDGTLVERDGVLTVAVGGKFVDPGEVEPRMKQQAAKLRARDFIRLRDKYQEVVDLMLSPEATDAKIGEAQKAMGLLYDQYVKDHGFVGDNRTKIFRFDPAYYLVLSLETPHRIKDPKKEGRYKRVFKKADIFSKRTLSPWLPPSKADSVSDGYRLSMVYHGELRTDSIAEWTGKTVDEVHKELREKDLAYLDPSTGLWTAKEKYLAGNVRRKLEEAKEAAKKDASLKANVEALEKIQPERRTIRAIGYRLGATWIEPSIIQQFAKSIGIETSVRYSEAEDKWHVSRGSASEEAALKFGTKDLSSSNLLEYALNLHDPAVYHTYKEDGKEKRVFDPVATTGARAAIQHQQDAFRKFVMGNKEIQATLEDAYNDKMNFYVAAKYDGSHLELPGSNNLVSLRPYQKDAVWRLIQDGHGLLAHSVGSGKTYTMIAAAMEMKRIGLAKKPMIVVDNSTLGQFATSFRKFYPGARVMVATQADLDAKKRKAFLTRIMSNDYDCVVIAQSSFNMIPVDESREANFLLDMIDELRQAEAEAAQEDGRNAPSVKDIERARKGLEKKLGAIQKKAKKSVEDVVTFEQLGIDALFVDEAHSYKKPPFVTKITKVSGIDTDASGRAFKTMMKVRHIQEKQKGRGIFFATGTPVTNTMGEAWHMLNMVAPQVLREFGVDTFDRFVSTFGEIRPVMEMSAGQTWVQKQTLAKFTNGPELLKMLWSVWDVVSPDTLTAYMRDTNQDFPELEGGKIQKVAVPLSPNVEKFNDFLKQVYEKFSKMTGKEKRENSWVPVVTYNAAKSAALDIRMVRPEAKDDPGSKVNRCVEEVLRLYQESANEKGVQAIFCDTFRRTNLSTLYGFMAGEQVSLEMQEDEQTQEEKDAEDGLTLAKSDRFLYEDVRKKLIKGGIPAEEIVLIHDVKPSDMEALFDRTNAGDVRVLIGNTPKMGQGVNIQQRLRALHHLDVPWRPDQLEQRNGRIIRYGNLHAEWGIPVSIYSYGMIKTLDAAIFNKIHRKAVFFWQLIAGKAEGTEFEDPAGGTILSAQEQVAALAGDPRVFERVELQGEVRELKFERESFADSIDRAERNLRTATDDAKRIEKKLIPLTEKQIKEASALGGVEWSVDKVGSGKKEEVVKSFQAIVDREKEAALKRYQAAKAEAGEDKEKGKKIRTGKPDRSEAFHRGSYRVNGFADLHIFAGVSTEMTAAGKIEIDPWVRFGIALDGQEQYWGNAVTAKGIFDFIESLPAVLERRLADQKVNLQSNRAKAAELESVVNQTWDKEAVLAGKEARLREVEAELSAPSGPSAAQQAQKEADKELGGDAAGIVPAFVRGQRRRSDVIPDSVKVDDEEVEARLQAARGVEKSSIAERVKEAAAASWRKSTRAQEFLPNTKRWASANERFRLLKVIPETAADETNRTVAAILNPMGKQQRWLFERKLLIDNLLDAVDRGEPLRFGFKDRDAVVAYQEKLADMVSKTPEVQQAFKTRNKIMQEFVRELVEYDQLPEKALGQTETYFHQQVLSRLQVERLATGGRRPQKITRSFQRRRVKGMELDAEYDYNTDYIEAEVSWMTDARIELEKEKWLRGLDGSEGVLDKLKAQAKAYNFETLVGGPDVVKRINELRGAIAESSNGPNSQESDDRQQRKAWIEELEDLDPTYPYRRRIAMHMGKIRKAVRGGKVNAGPFADSLDDNGELEDGRVFQFLRYLSENYRDEDVGIAARGVFKAIDERNKMIETALGDKFVTWEDMVPEGYAIWQPQPGNQFFMATTISEQLAEALQKGVLDELKLTADQLGKVLAMGGPKRQFVLPAEIVDQLKAMEKPKPTGPLGEAARELMRWWKVWTLLNPKRFLGYFVRNATGDIDPVAAAAPAAAKYVPQATKEIWSYYGQHLSLSDELRAARDLGVVSSTMTAEEIPDLKDLKVLRRFYGSGQQRIKMLGAGNYFEWIKEKNEQREGVLRYAAFLYYRKALRDGTLKHYGAAKKEVVDALKKEMGVDVAAAHLARNLLGDYGNLTVAGSWMRQAAYPFWSWVEVNLKRYPRLFENAWQYGRLHGNQKKAIAGVAAGATARAVYTAVSMMGISGLYAAMWAWNNLVHPDDEDDLPDYDRANPHVTMGRNPDGSVRVFRNTGAFGDFLEWFGLNTATTLYPKYRDGQVTLGDMAWEMAKDPVNKLVQGLRPDIKTGGEVLTGKTIFPDVTNPKPVDRSEAAASALGLRDEFKWARGKVTGSGETIRPWYLQRMLLGVSDPRQNALFEIADLRNDFLAKKGKERNVSFPASPIKSMREAAEREDYGAFRKARSAYLKNGRDYTDFIASLRNLDPVANRLNVKDEEEFEQKFLTSIQREKLVVARDYAKNLEVTLWKWWHDAAAPGEFAELRKTHAKTLANVKVPMRREKGETVDAFKKRKTSVIERRKRAAEAIKTLAGR